ncbi:MAG: aldo/keto reductase [Proteobacteria bacterium]|nr:aldo/keto reductase [Pseudomonadota bacterium]
MDRRSFVQGTAGTVALLSLSPAIRATVRMRARKIPSSGETLPVVGFGQSPSFREGDYDSARRLLDVLLEKGGRFIDTGARSQLVHGRYMQENDAHEKLFLAANMRTESEQEDLAYLRKSLEIQGKKSLDLVQLQRPVDFDGQWRRLRRWKEMGLTRHIGIAVSGERYFPMIESLLQSGTADFVQFNYSMLEPESGERLLPMARDKGVAVVINRPFVNGRYFPLISDKKLPEWAAEFDCDSWAQFSLKYILANPAVTCVLTETTKPHHAADNLSAGFGRLPDDKTLLRMIELIQSF